MSALCPEVPASWRLRPRRRVAHRVALQEPWSDERRAAQSEIGREGIRIRREREKERKR